MKLRLCPFAEAVFKASNGVRYFVTPAKTTDGVWRDFLREVNYLMEHDSEVIYVFSLFRALLFSTESHPLFFPADFLPAARNLRCRSPSGAPRTCRLSRLLVGWLSAALEVPVGIRTAGDTLFLPPTVLPRLGRLVLWFVFSCRPCKPALGGQFIYCRPFS